MNVKDIKISNVKDYYGKILQSATDLKTSACCASDSSTPQNVREVLKLIDDEIITRFYGCGSPIPPLLKGCTILDIGCGTGRDVYIASYLAGPDGFAIGVDMTDEQLDVAKRHINSQMEKFGFNKSNVRFKKGYIEDLKSLNIEDSSVDVVISNCVINLSPDKKSVFSEIFRVLKPGGELYFSDVFSGRRVPEHLKDDKVLHGECLAGAMYKEDFRRLLKDLRCADFRIVSNSTITIDNPEVESKIGMIDFCSLTIRAFKIDSLEDICEDYGQIAVYNGTIPENKHAFEFDDHHKFITGKPMLVCGNTATMLQDTRYGKHFKVNGNKKTHFGPFDCAPVYEKEDSGISNSGGGCC